MLRDGAEEVTPARLFQIKDDEGELLRRHRDARRAHLVREALPSRRLDRRFRSGGGRLGQHQVREFRPVSERP
jgi:hypothetical protein